LEAENARLGEQLAAAYNEHFGTAVDWAGKALSATEQRRRAEAAEAKLEKYQAVGDAAKEETSAEDLVLATEGTTHVQFEAAKEACRRAKKMRRAAVTALTDKEDE
jgi:hypothetical protein